VSGRPTEFTVDARKAGEKSPVEVFGKTADGDDIPVNVRDNGDGTYQCTYKPEKPIKHTIIPAYNGVAVKESPFRVRLGSIFLENFRQSQFNCFKSNFFSYLDNFFVNPHHQVPPFGC